MGFRRKLLYYCMSPRLILKSHHIKGFCIFLVCALLPINIMFYTRGCRHTKILFDPDQADSFRHGYPNHLPDHLFPQLTFIRDNTALSVDLLSAKVPPIVHFIWCDKDYFQFQNYLSVLSAFKFLKPTGIYFHYMQVPELDSDGYYQFFMDLKQDIPGLILQPLKSSRPCSGNHASKMNFVLELLNAQGGIFMSENTILADSLSNLRKKSVMYAVVGTEPVMVLMERGFLDSSNVKTDSADLLSDESKRFSCPENSSFRLGSQMYCTFVKTQIFPVTVFELKSDFGQLARWVAYGKADILRPSPANETVIPNIVHYVWLGERSLNYFAFLSLLSSLYVLNAEMVYIHGNFEPTGPHWDKIKHHIRVQFVLRDFPVTVFDQSIKFASHGSDYLRSDLLIRYGGIYTDWDVLWVHPIPDRLRQYELVACPDFPATGAFPDVFNMGVLLAAKGARFMRYFLESYHHYLNNHWSYNAIHMPYKVYEKHPDLLLVDRHLQVICARELCHPVWVPNFKDSNVNHLSTSSFDWKTETIAIHWTHPDPEEFASEEALTSSNTLFGSIGQFVLSKVKGHLEKELR